MSDPISHFAGGMLMTGVAGKVLGQRLLKQKKPRIATLALIGGALSALLDLDHLPRLIEAGWSVNRMLTDNNLDTPGRLIHVSITLIFVFLAGLMLVFLPKCAIKYRNIYSQITFWVTLVALAFVTHLFMDYVFYCVIYEAKCGIRWP
jgi:hypothetical protein